MNWIRIAVVGGVNLDVLGRPSGDYQPKDSLIGNVRFSSGGVGHNIAAQAVRTGADVTLFTVFSNDRNGEWLRQSCHEEGIRIDRARVLHGPCPVYMAIHGPDGDMISAVNDMSLMDQLSPALLQPELPNIHHADVCVLDANLSPESLEFLTSHVTIPLVCDPVSTEKAKRVWSLLPHLTAMKPNLLEARSMTGCDSPRNCAEKMISLGLKMAFISLGKDGLYYADSQSAGMIRPEKVSETLQTGAGDAVTAGIAIGVARNLPVSECALLGMKTAQKYLGCP